MCAKKSKYIDTTKVKEAFLKGFVDADKHPSFVKWLAEEAERIVKTIPSAKVQIVVRAVWLNVNEEENVYMCSECGDEVIFISGCPIQNGYKYCPFCGAKMGKRLRNNGKIH